MTNDPSANGGGHIGTSRGLMQLVAHPGSPGKIELRVNAGALDPKLTAYELTLIGQLAGQVDMPAFRLGAVVIYLTRQEVRLVDVKNGPFLSGTWVPGEGVVLSLERIGGVSKRVLMQLIDGRRVFEVTDKGGRPVGTGSLGTDDDLVSEIGRILSTSPATLNQEQLAQALHTDVRNLRHRLAVAGYRFAAGAMTRKDSTL